MNLFDEIKNKLSHEFIDIIEWLDVSNDTIVHRFERYQNEIKNNAKLIVREGQTAVFINEGQLAEMSFNSRILAPIIAGIDRRKEYRAAVSRSRPRKSPTAMVEPDLEIPGIMAMPCISPIIKASLIEKPSILLP